MGSWPSFDDLFGNNSPGNGGEYTYSPPNDYAVYSALGKKPTVEDIPWLKENQRTGGTRYDEAASWGYSAPDPEMAPEGMVVNPFAKLPGNNPYISEAEYRGMVSNGIVGDGGLSSFVDDTGQLHYIPNYDAYDATRLTAARNDPSAATEMGYNPGAPWQRENDYYAALANRNALSIATGGNYVTSKVGREGDTDIFEVRPIPKGYDMRQGEYYQPDGTVGGSDNRYVPTEPLFFGISDAEKKLVPAGMSYLDYVMSQDVSRSQPRANSMGEAGFGIGGVVQKGTEANIEGTPAYDYLRRMTPSTYMGTDGVERVDPNPFRGNIGTSTEFTAKEGDSPSTYPGVAFYEVQPDGNFKKVTTLTPGKSYVGIRESYDYVGFTENPTMKNAAPGTVFQTRVGSGGDTSLDDVSDDYSVGTVRVDNKNYTAEQIANNEHGYGAGVLPAGAGITLVKKAPANDGSYTLGHVDDLTPEQIADIGAMHPGYPNFVPVVKADGSITFIRRTDAEKYGVKAEDDILFEGKKPSTETPKRTDIYWDETNKVWVDRASGKVWKDEATGWVDKPKNATPTLPPTSTPAPDPVQPAQPAGKFEDDIVVWLASHYALTNEPYIRGNDAYYIDVAESSLGSNADQWPSYVDIQRYDAKNDMWRTVKAGEILEPGQQYRIKVTKSDLDKAKKATQGKK